MSDKKKPSGKRDNATLHTSGDHETELASGQANFEGSGLTTHQPKPDKDLDPFILEKVFPDPITLLNIPAAKTKALATDALFVLDANALLVPFEVGKAGQEEIIKLYTALHAHERLYVPEHALREYLRNRENKVAVLHDRLTPDVIHLDKIVSTPQCAMLEYSEEHTALAKATEDLKAARQECLRRLEAIRHLLANWRWDDPISKLYTQVFNSTSVIKCPQGSDKLSSDLEHRIKHKLPPGYKDAAKADGGIGDLIIWHTLIDLSKQKKKGIVFVSNDEKPDWMIRNSTGGLFPRFELVAEFYHKARQQFAIVSYSRFLELHDLSPDTVDMVRDSYAEGLGRFNNLRKRLISVLERLNGILLDFAVSAFSGEYSCIRDNRLRGLILGFHECYSAYLNIYGSGPGLHHMQRFEEILNEISTLNAGIEFEERRMKRDTTEATIKIKVLCDAFNERWADFVEVVLNTPEW